MLDLPDLEVTQGEVQEDPDVQLYNVLRTLRQEIVVNG
jgi:hypothetical protein